MKSSDGSPIPRDAVLSHEKGHAKSFLDVAMKRFRSAVKKYSSKRLEELSASEISDIRTAYEDSCNEAMDDSCVKSNSATFDWFKSRGIKLKIYH